MVLRGLAGSCCCRGEEEEEENLAQWKQSQGNLNVNGGGTSRSQNQEPFANTLSHIPVIPSCTLQCIGEQKLYGRVKEHGSEEERIKSNAYEVQCSMSLDRKIGPHVSSRAIVGTADCK